VVSLSVAGAEVDASLSVERRTPTRNSALLTIGEVRTALLQSSFALSNEQAGELLDLIPGDQVTWRERPIPQVVSPSVLTGVDCPLPGRSGARVRAVGTVGTRVGITQGHLVQAWSRIGLEPGTAGRRAPWSHYLARPGTGELLGRGRPEDLADGFLADNAPGSTLDLGAITARQLDRVQRHPTLDHEPPFRLARTRLRWAHRPAEQAGLRFVLDPSGVRLVELSGPDGPAAAESLCVELARHDWLLTGLTTVLDRAGIGRRPARDILAGLQPAVDHLIHLWMPGADAGTDALWKAFSSRSGMERQWQTAVARVRDQLALAAALALTGPPGTTGSGDG
jgi:hypothetical protein